MSVAAIFGVSLSAQEPEKQTGGNGHFPVIHRVDISARNLSLKAADNYPQKLLEAIRDDDTVKTVRSSTFNPYEDPVRGDMVKKIISTIRRKNTARPLRIFFKPTHYVNSRSKITERVADTLFDAELASALDAGKSMTVPSDSAILRGKGTCSEASNIFLALMRYKGIPARMVVGYGYEPLYNVKNSHAWVECYIENAGWWAVNPQNGSISIPYFCYKLFVGRDFRDCRIKKLPDMYLSGESPFTAEKIVN